MKKYNKPEIEIVKLADSLMGDVNIGIGSIDHSGGKADTGKDHQDNGLFSTEDQQDHQQKPVWE